MKLRLVLLMSCIIATLMLTGCKESGSGESSFVGSRGGGNFAGGGGDDAAGIDGGVVNPEPATIALLSGGLVAYALLRRRKKR